MPSQKYSDEVRNQVVHDITHRRAPIAEIALIHEVKVGTIYRWILNELGKNSGMREKEVAKIVSYNAELISKIKDLSEEKSQLIKTVHLLTRS